MCVFLYFMHYFILQLYCKVAHEVDLVCVCDEYQTGNIVVCIFTVVCACIRVLCVCACVHVCHCVCVTVCVLHTYSSELLGIHTRIICHT